MGGAAGYFEYVINTHADRIGAADRRLIEAVTAEVQALLGGQVFWAGSRRKGTAITDSDLDLCVQTVAPVTVAQRRALAKELETRLGYPCTPHRHVIRLRRPAATKVDVAFANAAFGSRALPDPSPFHDRPARQQAVRALKLWGRQPGLPPLPGWAAEALVLFRDQPAQPDGLALFLRVIDWLADRANPSGVEAVLRPVAEPAWRPDWSAKLPGRLQALSNGARALRKRHPSPEAWTSGADAERWLIGR